MASAAIIALLMFVMIGCACICSSIVASATAKAKESEQNLQKPKQKQKKKQNNAKKNTQKQQQQKQKQQQQVWIGRDGFTSKPGGGYWGGSGGKRFDAVCGTGAYIDGIQFWYSDKKAVHGLGGTCVNPATGESYSLFGASEITGTAAKQASKAERIAKGIVNTVSLGLASPILSEVGTGDGQGYETKGTTTTSGFNRVDVIWNDKEIKGLNFYSVDGRQTGHGGEYGHGFSSTQTVVRCPKGTVLSGFRGSSGARIDSLMFRCG